MSEQKKVISALSEEAKVQRREKSTSGNAVASRFEDDNLQYIMDDSLFLGSVGFVR